MKLVKIILTLLVVSISLIHTTGKSYANTSIDSTYVFFPKSFVSGNFQSSLGISITRLPLQIVEEEINYSPTLNFDFRYGLSNNFSLIGSFNSNFITNQLNVGSMWSGSIDNFSYYFGAITSGWYSFLNTEAIKLNTYGITITPRISVGYNFHNLLASVQLESHHHIFWNYLEKEYLGSTKILDGGFSMNFITEQPFTNDLNLVLALRLHYNKFFYQSWLAYSFLDEYLFYPEFYCGILL